MSGRMCTVHGEWCPIGVCRWCEPTKPGLELVPLREGERSTPCRCGWMAWADYARRPFREEHNGVVHSPEQCYATAATPPAEPPTYMGVPVAIDPYASGDAPPVLVSWTLLDETPEAYFWRLEWVRTEAVVDFDANAIQESLLAEQHAALRWERVARRWNYKHRGEGADEDVRAEVWRYWLALNKRRV